MVTFKGNLSVSLLWIFLICLEGKELTISCLNSADCVLPCRFQSDSKGVRVMWYKGKTIVSCTRYGHTRFVDKDHFEQAPQYNGRTSLYVDQVLEGNATLVLRDVSPIDQGKYFCITMTAQRTEEACVIYVVVKAPVRTINIYQEKNIITCISEGIYPEPALSDLSWSTKPPVNTTVRTTTRVQKTEQQLYNIIGSLILSDSVSDLVYSCTVSTGTNRRTATLFRPTSINGSDIETTIPCSVSNSSLTGFSLVWKFNHRQIILVQTTANDSYTVSERWRRQVKGVSGSGSLTLTGLSPSQEGIYTCEVSDDEETNIMSAALRIETSQSRYLAPIIVIVSSGAAVFALLLICVWKKRKGKIDLKTLKCQGPQKILKLLV